MSILLRMLPALLLCLMATGARADAGKTILVFDASGSMWGQVEGEAKITIAQRVLGELLDTLPAEQELGLLAYGHRRKGDCADIELLVPAGPGTRDQIRAAVQGITPKGKTPLSQAVIDAASALKFEEARATVILLSDGIETCDLDPCAVGRELEAAGVNFTAHVIGFDVAGIKEQEQLRCLAENTGGKFLPAANAAELAAALRQVSVEQPAPAELSVLFRATDGESGPVIDTPLLWSVTKADGSPLLQDESAATVERTLPAGRYSVVVTRPADQARATHDFTLENGGGQLVVTLVLDSVMPTATLQAPDAAPAGSAVTVAHTGPKTRADEIRIAAVGSRDGDWLRYGAVREDDSIVIDLPTLPGVYEIRYVDGRNRVLARRPIEATPIAATLTAPDAAAAGDAITVSWTGPNYRGDYISVAQAGADDDARETYAEAGDTPSVELRLPAEAGDYEVRYVLGQDNRVLARRPIAIGAIAATLTAADSAPAGSTLDVAWTGPGYAQDFISVSRADATDGSYINYVDVSPGAPAALLLPAEPGSYELRYVVNQTNLVLARRGIEVTAVAAGLQLPATAPAGGKLEIAWTGPAYLGDYISISRADQGDGTYLEYTNVRDGSPLTLQLPAEPGTYEVRYVVAQDNSVLVRAPVTLTEVTASLLATASAPAGALLEVGWSGPAYQGDFISVVKAGADPGAYLRYANAREGENPVSLQMPGEPGDYEIRYVVAQGPKVLATQAITLTEVMATLAAPPSGKAGGTLPVTWTGPDYRGDYISVAKPGADDGSYLQYRNTKQGNPLDLPLPDQPGSYEIRYVMNEGNRVLARTAVTVE